MLARQPIARPRTARLTRPMRFSCVAAARHFQAGIARGGLTPIGLPPLQLAFLRALRSSATDRAWHHLFQHVHSLHVQHHAILARGAHQAAVHMRFVERELRYARSTRLSQEVRYVSVPTYLSALRRLRHMDAAGMPGALAQHRSQARFLQLAMAGEIAEHRPPDASGRLLPVSASHEWIRPAQDILWRYSSEYIARTLLAKPGIAVTQAQRNPRPARTFQIAVPHDLQAIRPVHLRETRQHALLLRLNTRRNLDLNDGARVPARMPAAYARSRESIASARLPGADRQALRQLPVLASGTDRFYRPAEIFNDERPVRQGRTGFQIVRAQSTVDARPSRMALWLSKRSTQSRDPAQRNSKALDAEVLPVLRALIEQRGEARPRHAIARLPLHGHVLDRLAAYSRQWRESSPERPAVATITRVVPMRADFRLADQATPPVPAASHLPQLDRYRPVLISALSYRRSSSVKPAEIQRQIEHIEHTVQTKVVREIMHHSHTLQQIRGAVADTLLSPQVMRSLTQKIHARLEQRAAIERYRRGER